MQQPHLWPGGAVPRFDEYYAPVGDADPQVKAYYRWLKQELDQWRSPDVDGQVSYLFAYIYGVIRHFVRYRNYLVFEERFDWLRENYGHTKVRSYLDRWHSDAAILTGRWAEAFELHQTANMALIHHISQFGPSPMLNGDTLSKLAGFRVPLTQWGARRRKHVTAAAEHIAATRHVEVGGNIVDEAFLRFPGGASAVTDQDIDILMDDLDNGLDMLHLAENLRSAANHARMFRETPEDHRVTVFNGVGVYVDPATVPAIPSFHGLVIENRAKWLFREAENKLRRDAGVPEVGDGWLSETELFQLIRGAFPDTRVVRHARPSWLVPQHLDVYLPRENVAIEFQGEQHYAPVEIFGGEVAFQKQQERDARKRSICEENGCLLLEVRSGYDPDLLIKTVRDAVSIRTS